MRDQAKEAADDELILAFGRLQGAANRLEYLLGKAIEEECGISHLMFEVLLILGRAGEPGLSMGAIAQEQVLTTGGVTRLVDRMEAAGLVERAETPADATAITGTRDYLAAFEAELGAATDGAALTTMNTPITDFAASPPRRRGAPPVSGIGRG